MWVVEQPAPTPTGTPAAQPREGDLLMERRRRFEDLQRRTDELERRRDLEQDIWWEERRANRLREGLHQLADRRFEDLAADLGEEPRPARRDETPPTPRSRRPQPTTARTETAAPTAPAAPAPVAARPEATRNDGQTVRRRWRDPVFAASASEQDVRDKGWGDGRHGLPSDPPSGMNPQRQEWYRAAYAEGLAVRQAQQQPSTAAPAPAGAGQPVVPAQPAAAQPAAEPNAAALGV